MYLAEQFSVAAHQLCVLFFQHVVPLLWGLGPFYHTHTHTDTMRALFSFWTQFLNKCNCSRSYSLLRSRWFVSSRVLRSGFESPPAPYAAAHFPQEHAVSAHAAPPTLPPNCWFGTWAVWRSAEPTGVQNSGTSVHADCLLYHILKVYFIVCCHQSRKQSAKGLPVSGFICLYG